MRCGVCETNFPEEALFCPKCGERKKAAEDATRPAAVHSPPVAKTGVEKLRNIMSEKLETSARSEEPEKILWHGGYSPKAMIGGWLLSLIVTIVLIVAAVFLGTAFPPAWFLAGVAAAAIWGGHIAMFFYQRWSVDYELTSQRFIHRLGFFNRVTNRIEVIDIDDVQVTQSFVERMLGVGTIRILSSDTSDPKVILPGIDDVNRVATLIDDVRRTERRKRGVHIEAV